MSVSPRRPLVLGISAAVPDRVIDEAVAFARDLGVHLVCAFVDETRVPIGEAPDGTVVTAPVAAGGPCSAASIDEIAGEGVAERVTARAESAGVVVDFRALAGDPVTALSRLAVDLDARALVVGTRKPGVRAGIQLLLAGPIASRLARRQPVPVIVVPVHERAPLPSDAGSAGLPDDIPSPEDVLYGEGHA